MTVAAGCWRAVFEACGVNARRRSALVFTSLLACLTPVASGADGWSPSEAVPQEFLACTTCHGVDLAGNAAVNAPRLAGLPAWYVRDQLYAFRRGWRGVHADDAAGAAMRAAVKVLPDDAAMYAVAAYLVGQNPEQKSGSAPASLEPGSTSQPEDTAVQSKNKASSLVGMAGAATLALAVGVGNGASAEVRRHKLPDSDFPIAEAVEVLPGTTLVYHSGMIPRPADPDAEEYSPEYWGDTEAQALSVFSRLEDSLTAKGLTFGDVIKMQVFLVAPEAGGMMDFEGMMRAYRRYFGTDDQPKLPARSAMQVAGLARPGMLVEIEVVLARP